MENKENSKKEEILGKLNNELKQENVIKEGNYIAVAIIGNGTFGTVYQAKNEKTGEIVAIKRVFQDERYKNRELQTLKRLKHPNIIELKQYFFTKGDKEKEVYLNCVTDYLPQTLSKVVRSLHKSHQQMDFNLLKLYSYQMFKGLGYIHAINICHRDIKPQNIIIDNITNVAKICDFGSAKSLQPGQTSIAYICSRYYRAPELIFGATHYTNQIDVWSMGCVLAEMVLGRPLFAGDSPSDQLVEIIKVLGTPSKEEIYEMNPEYKEQKFPDIKKTEWDKVFKNRKIPNYFYDLLDKLLIYNPKKRLNPIKVLCHPFYDELREHKLKVPEGTYLPKNLFEFSSEEINFDKESCEFIQKFKNLYEKKDIINHENSKMNNENFEKNEENFEENFNMNFF